MAFSTLTAVLNLDSSGFRAGVDDAQRDLDSLNDRAASAGRRMQRVGGMMTAGLTAPLAAMGVASVQTASDVEEMRSKMGVVFQGLEDDVVEWSETHADAVNRSAFQLQEYATSLQDTFVPMGFARDEAANMSMQLAELGVDLASFNNMAEDEALQKLQSGLVGNHRALREFGVMINQSRLEQELLNMGIEDGVQAATEQQKAQARMNLIMKDTKDAQGDAARTSDSFANQLRGLKSDTEELRAELGQHLVPVATTLIGHISNAVGWFGELDKSTQRLIIVGGGFVAVLGPLIVLLGTVFTSAAAVAAGFGTLAGMIGGASAMLTGTLIPAIHATMVAMGPIGWVLLALSGIIAGLALAWKQDWFGMREKTEEAAGAIGKAIDWIIEQINKIPGVDIESASAEEKLRDLASTAEDTGEKTEAALEPEPDIEGDQDAERALEPTGTGHAVPEDLSSGGTGIPGGGGGSTRTGAFGIEVSDDPAAEMLTGRRKPAGPGGDEGSELMDQLLAKLDELITTVEDLELVAEILVNDDRFSDLFEVARRDEARRGKRQGGINAFRQ